MTLNSISSHQFLVSANFFVLHFFFHMLNGIAHILSAGGRFDCCAYRNATSFVSLSSVSENPFICVFPLPLFPLCPFSRSLSIHNFSRDDPESSQPTSRPSRLIRIDIRCSSKLHQFNHPSPSKLLFCHFEKSLPIVALLH